MKQRIARWITSFAVLCVAGCATKSYNPFRVGEAELRQQVTVIALEPTTIAVRVNNPSEARNRIDTFIAESMQRTGFQVVPASTVTEINQRFRSGMGDLFDPKTGKADEEKFKKVTELTRRELVEKHHIDAILSPHVIVVSAGFYEYRATWDDVHEETTIDSSLGQKLYAFRTSGRMSALSLWMRLKNLNGDVLYSNGCGLQLLTKLDKGRFVDRPVNDLMIDPALESRAVDISLQPLLPPKARSP